MTRKDLILIAAAVNNMNLHYANILHVALMLADALRSTNPSFDRDRFIEACMKGH